MTLPFSLNNGLQVVDQAGLIGVLKVRANITVSLIKQAKMQVTISSDSESIAVCAEVLTVGHYQADIAGVFSQKNVRRSRSRPSNDLVVTV